MPNLCVALPNTLAQMLIYGGKHFAIILFYTLRYVLYTLWLQSCLRVTLDYGFPSIQTCLLINILTTGLKDLRYGFESPSTGSYYFTIND